MIGRAPSEPHKEVHRVGWHHMVNHRGNKTLWFHTHQRTKSKMLDFLFHALQKEILCCLTMKQWQLEFTGIPLMVNSLLELAPTSPTYSPLWAQIWCFIPHYTIPWLYTISYVVYNVHPLPTTRHLWQVSNYPCQSSFYILNHPTKV